MQAGMDVMKVLANANCKRLEGGEERNQKERRLATHLDRSSMTVHRGRGSIHDCETWKTTTKADPIKSQMRSMRSSRLSSCCGR